MDKESLVWAGIGMVAGALLTAGTCIGLHDAVKRQNVLLAEQLTDARILMVEVSAELTAVRDSGTCAGIPILEEHKVGRVNMIRGDGFVAMVAAE